jgi:hypothetical protein
MEVRKSRCVEFKSYPISTKHGGSAMTLFNLTKQAVINGPLVRKGLYAEVKAESFGGRMQLLVFDDGHISAQGYRQLRQLAFAATTAKELREACDRAEQDS